MADQLSPAPKERILELVADLAREKYSAGCSAGHPLGGVSARQQEREAAETEAALIAAIEAAFGPEQSSEHVKVEGDVVTIYGVRYSLALLSHLGLGPIGSRVEIVSREDGVLTLRSLPDEPRDERTPANGRTPTEPMDSSQAVRSEAVVMPWTLGSCDAGGNRKGPGNVPAPTSGRFQGSLSAQLVNIAVWIENGCEPMRAAEELRMLSGFVTRPPETTAEWQPIETAPRDGTDVLVACFNYNDPTRGQHHKVAAYAPERDAWSGAPDDPDGHYDTYPPTHWMPLPPLPSPVNAGEKS